eukprot:gene17619-biopygen18905
MCLARFTPGLRPVYARFAPRRQIQVTWAQTGRKPGVNRAQTGRKPGVTRRADLGCANQLATRHGPGHASKGPGPGRWSRQR